MCYLIWMDLLLQKKDKVGLTKNKFSRLMRQYIRQSKLFTRKVEEAYIEPVPKKQRYYLIWNNCGTLPLSVLLQHKFNFLFIFQTFLQLTTRYFTIITMEFPVSNKGI